MGNVGKKPIERGGQVSQFLEHEKNVFHLIRSSQIYQFVI
jgi:hypothetical protein